MDALTSGPPNTSVAWQQDPDHLWKEDLELRRYKFEEEYFVAGLGGMHYFTFMLGVAYGQLPLRSLQTDTTQERYDRILDTTIRPKGAHFGQPETAELLAAADDGTFVEFDSLGGNVTLVSDDFSVNGLEGDTSLPGKNFSNRIQIELQELEGSMQSSRTPGSNSSAISPVVFDTEAFKLQTILFNQIDEQEESNRQRQAWSTNRIPIDQGERISIGVVEGLVADSKARFANSAALRFYNEGGEIRKFYESRNGLLPAQVLDDKYAVITDIVGDRLYTWVVEKYEAFSWVVAPSVGGLQSSDGFFYRVVSTSFISLDEVIETSTHQEIDSLLGRLRTQAVADNHVQRYLNGKAAKKAKNLADATNFVLHMLPLGAAKDSFDEGSYREAAFSLVGDAASFIGGPLAIFAKKISTLNRGAKIARGRIIASASLEGAVGLSRLGQGGVALYNGNHGQAAGYLGEAALRLFSVAVDIKTIRVNTASAGVLQSTPHNTTELGLPVTENNIIKGLRGVTAQSDRIADLIEKNIAKLRILPEEKFKAYYNSIFPNEEAPQAFAVGKVIVIKDNSISPLTDVVHEGSHVIQALDRSTNTRHIFETQAYRHEINFRRKLGLSSPFDTQSLQKHIEFKDPATGRRRYDNALLAMDPELDSLFDIPEN